MMLFMLHFSELRNLHAINRMEKKTSLCIFNTNNGIYSHPTHFHSISSYYITIFADLFNVAAITFSKHTETFFRQFKKKLVFYVGFFDISFRGFKCLLMPN